MRASAKKYPQRVATATNDIAEAHIESLNYDGCGVAHVNGKVTFIEDALPGETVRLRYLNRRRNFDSGKLVEILSPTPDRVAPACAHFGTCGGCSLQHLRPDAQIRAKQQVLAGQLEHIGKVSPESWLAPLTGPAWGYRRRARLGVRQIPGKDGVLVGFRERRKSFLANLNECPVLEPKLAALLPALRELIAQLSCPHRIPQIEVAVGDNAIALVLRHLLALTEADRTLLCGFAQQHSLQVYLQGGGPDSIVPLWPEIPTPLYYRLPEYDVTLHFRPTDFIQVNNALNQRLVHQALTLLELKPADRVLDLFCGLGNFTLPLARHAQQVLGIEADAQLIAGARRNAERNGLNNAEFRQADLYYDKTSERSEQGYHSADTTPEVPWNGFGFNKLLLDPPRNGAIEAIKRLPREGVERIVYVSCYPATLARDAEYLVHVLGFRLAAAGVMDMFPHTSHVESMALFIRP